MFRVKITRCKKGNISIGVLIILSIVLINLVIVIISLTNMYRGSRVCEIKAYRDDRDRFENSIKYEQIENEILNMINGFVTDNKKEGMTIEDTLQIFPYSIVEKYSKYKIGYDSKINNFFLDEDMQPRKRLAYFIEDGKLVLKLTK